MKKIALDLDGVVFDTENLYRVYTEMYDVDENNKDTLIDNSQRIFQKRYDWSEEEFTDFYNKYAEKVLLTTNFMTGVDIVLNKLKEKYEFVIVTSRSDSEADIARDRLRQIGFSNIKIFNNEHQKIDRFLSEDVSYVIDDDEGICMDAIDNNICALYFKNNASNRSQKDNIINVNNWGEIYKYFMLNGE